MPPPKLPLALLIALAALSACADLHWERAFYEGVRRGAENAAQRPGSAVVPQTTRLPEYTQYEQERQRLMISNAAAAKASSPQ